MGLFRNTVEDGERFDVVAAGEEDMSFGVRKLPRPLKEDCRVGLESLEAATHIDDAFERAGRLPVKR